MSIIKERESVCICKDGKLYRYGEDGLTPLPKGKSKSYFCGLFISPEDIYSHTITLPTDISEDAFDAQVEITLFESKQLDLQNSYLIAYKKNLDQSGDVWVVEAFIAEENRVYELYDDIADRVGHIDLIAIPYLAYEAWYIEKFGEYRDSIDLIIKLENRNSFIALYKNGQFIAYQKIYSLEYMSKKIGIKLELLRNVLIKRGLNENLYKGRERIVYDKIYSMFIDIMRQIDRLIRSKSQYFELSKIDTMILDFEENTIPNFWELLDDYGFYNTKKEILLFRDNDNCIDDLECIKNLYILYTARGIIDAPNLTPFKERPKLISTWVGKLFGSIFISILLILSLELYFHYKLHQLNTRNIELDLELSQLKKKAKEYRKVIKSLKSEIKSDREKLLNINNKIISFKEAVRVLERLKRETQNRQEMLKDINSIMQNYHIMSSSMDINNSKIMTIEVIVPYEKRYEIASLMSDIKVKGYKSVKTDLISLDKNLYRSRIVIQK